MERLVPEVERSAASFLASPISLISSLLEDDVFTTKGSGKQGACQGPKDDYFDAVAASLGMSFEACTLRLLHHLGMGLAIANPLPLFPLQPPCQPSPHPCQIIHGQSCHSGQLSEGVGDARGKERVLYPPILFFKNFPIISFVDADFEEFFS
jgi:hypothetical protein